MEYINGYKYDTLEQALDAISRCNTHYGIPIEGSETKNWCYYETAELNTPVFYYIKAHESLVAILGYPTMMEVIIAVEQTL